MAVSRYTSPQTRFSILMITIALANFMSALDASIVNVALPTISEIFAILPGTASLVLTVYVLVMAGTVLIFGKVADRVGFKKMFITGFGIFTLGSLFCGLLPALFDSFPVFVAARAFQAIGATMITAIGPGMIASYIPLSKRGTAMGTIFTLAALGMAIGPTAGGIMTEFFHWSWIFFINIPIGIGTILLAHLIIPDIDTRTTGSGFDTTGALLVFAGLSSLLFVLSNGEAAGWTSPVILGFVLLAILTLAGFARRELAVPDPLLELRLFQQRTFLMPTILVLLVNLSLAGVMYLVPFYLQYVKELTPSLVGAIYTSLSIGIMIGGILGGMLNQKIGGRKMNTLSWIPYALGFLILTRIQPGMGNEGMIVCLLLIGFGAGTMTTTGSNMIINTVARQYRGMISGFISLLRFLPITMGVAIFTIIFMAGIPAGVIPEGSTGITLAGIPVEDLIPGFDQAFLFAFLVSVMILAFACTARDDIHLDSCSGK